ncbi:MAG: UDP-N-acetylmuramate--L-alanine ligase [Candidatus Falkowbacteria bacterium]
MLKAQKIYMIGIKGVGMTMLAQFLAKNGNKITGSDIDEKFMTDKILKKSGAKVIEKFNAKNIPSDTDLIVYSSAYNIANNPEVEFALSQRKIKVLSYAPALAKIFNGKYGIAVTGSHGKTTTTAWLGYILEKAGKDPSVMVGSHVPQFEGASLSGKSNYLVIEADEYQNKLAYFHPKVVLLNNIDYDHPDYFKTKNEYKNVFIEFIKKIPKKGFLVANWDDNVIKKMMPICCGENCGCKMITYGINRKANYIAQDIKHKNNKQYFSVKLRGDGDLGNFCIQLLGRHNIYNALAVIATCVELEVELTDIRKYLEEFSGTERRTEIIGEYKGATVFDDYAHHPTEVKATFSGISENYPKNKITVVFHPHTFSRTKALLEDFAKSFNNADEVIILDIYGSAREKHGGISSKDLVDRIKKQKDKNSKQKIIHISDFKKCEEYIRKNAKKNDVIILMGAGDVFKIGKTLIKK